MGCAAARIDRQATGSSIQTGISRKRMVWVWARSQRAAAPCVVSITL
jgi:hypothetical protein